MPTEAEHARALLLALLRDRRPGDGAYAALVEVAGYYLRLNPNDAEMREAWDRFAGRPATAERCAHNGFLLAEPAESGCTVRCALCGTVGPVRDTSEAARTALLALRARQDRKMGCYFSPAVLLAVLAVIVLSVAIAAMLVMDAMI